MRKIFEKGDKVTVGAEDSFGICYTNPHGGTSCFPIGTLKQCEIIRTWHDYETGQRYVGRTSDGQEIYFGQFGVSVEETE